MKNLDTNHPRAWLLLLVVVILVVPLVVGWLKLNSFYEKHWIQTNNPVNISFKPVFEIRDKEEPKAVEKPLILDYPEEIDTDLEKYICDKFGTFECKTALAVSLAENGTRQRDRFNINTNGTIDVGIFQINSIHFDKEGCALYQIVDPIQNTDCAYKIWQESGWSAWVAFTTYGYLAKLDK